MTQHLASCPWCGSDEHLSYQWPGSMTADMPDRPCRVVCTHIDHDTVVGPTAYGKFAATSAWNTRLTAQSGEGRSGAVRRDWVSCPICNEPDMRQEIDAENNRLIFCVNHSCPSNGAVEGRSGAGEDAVEAVAQWLHDEGGFGDSFSGRTWPEHPDDTGQREGGWVKLVPSDVQAKFRDVARRLLTQPAAAALNARQSGEGERS